MKLLHTLRLPLALLALGLLVLSAGTSESLLGAPAPVDDDETELGEHMHTLEDLVKSLRKNLRAEGTYPEALEVLVQMEGLTLTCKALEPALGTKLPAAERTSFRTAFRRTMVEFLTRQLALETALLDADTAAVKEAFKRIREMEDDSHDRFAPEED
jgi:hypothetical protein